MILVDQSASGLLGTTGQTTGTTASRNIVSRSKPTQATKQKTGATATSVGAPTSKYTARSTGVKKEPTNAAVFYSQQQVQIKPKTGA